MNCAYISMKDYHAFVHDILSMSLFHLELSDTSFYQLVNAFDSLLTSILLILLSKFHYHGNMNCSYQVRHINLICLLLCTFVPKFFTI